MRVCQPPGLARADLPERRQRTVIPEKEFIAVFIQFRDPDAVPVGNSLLCHNIHGDLRQVQVCSDSHGSRNTGAGKHIPDDGHGHHVSRFLPDPPGFLFVSKEIGTAVNKALVNAVDMNVPLTDIFQVDRINESGDPFILGHAGSGDDIIDFCSMLRFIQADCLLGFEKPGPRRNSDRFE